MGPRDQHTDDRLPPVQVDVDTALDRIRTRGRRRRRRNTAVLAVGAIAVVVLAAAVAVAATRDTGEEGVVADGGTPSVPPSTDASGETVRIGDPATWRIDPDAPPDPEATSFTALVTRLGCHGGVTGEVIAPSIVWGSDDVEAVITFSVAPAEPGAHECPGNDEVPFQVDMGSPIGDLYLRDGTCLQQPLATHADCVVDDGTAEGRFSDVRWPEGAVLEPRECETYEGSRIDVAHEPDWRRNADFSTVTDADRCIVRIDIVAERPGSDHCGQGAARVLITGDPIGAAYTTATDSVEYVRDPDGLFGDADLAAGYREELTVPEGSEFSGYLIGDRPIWIDPADPDAVWVIAEDTTAERWPRGETPPCR